eukprot:gnl/MRDRNA2_/MRDRNA2_189070_c0_seq1.p1 gnl/MRDRNA2_/MRDRNA2_189070_c0~~gnl/MRDRNA2_/MRDRNA2_189070_c0_seq1.p1  ORF type:complete len:324 (-),score=61.57 gnl/MRDRNA2_/MRDRNA2_189070_c0_seq1:11-928(-)
MSRTSTHDNFICPAQRLRKLLEESGSEVLLMPCCGDALTAKLVLEAGFKIAFLSGFSVAAYRGHPDTGLISYAEQVNQASQVREALGDRIPLICDADTGYGNPLNVERTMRGMVHAGCAGVMLEDQENPKRCGHTRGKRVVDWSEAEARLQAAVNAREKMRAEGVGDLFIIARTDARETHSLDEAIHRCQKFMQLGADMTFMEAPRNVAEMRRYCSQVPGFKMANMLEGGLTPILAPKDLEDIGYKLVTYPLSLLAAGVKAQQEVLRRISAGDIAGVEDMILPFEETRRIVGFDDYYAREKCYKY